MSEHDGEKRMMRRAVHAVWASAVLVFVAWGCGTSSAEKIRAAKLAGSCSINTDCEGELVCAFGRCHIACTEDRDCPPTLRCVNGQEEGTFVCQLPEEVECSSDRDCPGKQVCGIDDECRDRCDTDGDCTKTQICANSNECASTDAGRDQVDADGNIVTGGGGSAGSDGGGMGGEDTAGRGGSGGAGGSVAGSAGDEGGSGEGGEPGQGGSATGGRAGSGGSAGASGGVGGMGGMGGMSGAGGNTAGVGGNAGASGSAGNAGMGGSGGEVLTETPDGVETIDNDTRQTALPITLPALATIHVPAFPDPDQDWFSITFPNDGRSHVISIVINQEADVATSVQGVTLVNNYPMGTLGFTPGTTSYVYATAGPGATLLFNFGRDAGRIPGGLAHLSFTDATENDDNEPNNSKDTATPIELDTTYSGQVLNPWVSDIDRPNEDWFAVDLAAGQTTVTLTAVPSQGRIQGYRVVPSGASSSIGVSTVGATGSFTTFTVTTPGIHYVEFVPYTDISGFSAGAKPTYLTQQYSFRVTQP
jgi:hypothetical protein